MGILHIYSQCLRVNDELNRIVQGRKSILLKKTSDVLQGCNIFSACVIEMNSSCPLLLKILISSLGRYDTVEKKIATLATIYGMIIHSRDHLASAIQRFYSSLAIRYHADNKVFYCFISTQSLAGQKGNTSWAYGQKEILTGHICILSFDIINVLDKSVSKKFLKH